MKKLVVLAAILAASVAAAAGVTLLTAVRYEFTNCSASGSASQNVKKGAYLFRALQEDLWICYATTCPSGGEVFPAGTVILLNLQDNTDVSCRSAAATGDAVFTKGS